MLDNYESRQVLLSLTKSFYFLERRDSYHYSAAVKRSYIFCIRIKRMARKAISLENCRLMGRIT